MTLQEAIESGNLKKLQELLGDIQSKKELFDRAPYFFGLAVSRGDCDILIYLLSIKEIRESANDVLLKLVKGSKLGTLKKILPFLRDHIKADHEHSLLAAALNATNSSYPLNQASLEILCLLTSAYKALELAIPEELTFNSQPLKNEATLKLLMETLPDDSRKEINELTSRMRIQPPILPLYDLINHQTIPRRPPRRSPTGSSLSFRS